MSVLPALPPLPNPLTLAPPLGPIEILAGPFGLLVYLPLLPLVWLIARRHRAGALISVALIWLLITLHAIGTLVVLGWLAGGVTWLLLLARWRRRGVLRERSMIALVWLGLHAWIAPFWWYATQMAWYPSRLQALHNVGLAYLLLRLIAWGVQLAREPGQARRLLDTAAWLLYPPCMRLGPVVLREQFLERFDAWNPRQGIRWGAGLKRFGMFLLGGVALGFVARQIPQVRAADFFSTPGDYTTGELLRVLYLVPAQVYLLLWTYNELAVALSLWTGIRVDNNFNWLPLATSVRDFWRRWHITLGAWLRMYIYIPLGGNRRHVVLNYLMVFVYCGLWHGPAWSFVAWALTQVVALNVQRWWDRLPAPQWAQRGPVRWAWRGLSWLLTIQYQLVTVMIFVDFEHLGLRLLGELWQRLA